MKLLLVLMIVGCAVALPKSYYKRYSESARLQANYARPRRAPLHRTMLISGYYRPVYAQRRQAYEPETAMTAFAAGDSVAAGSYLGTRVPNCASCDTVEQQDPVEYENGPAPQLDQPLSEEKPVSDLSEPSEPLVPAIPISDEVVETEVAPPKAVVPRRKTNKKLKQPVPVPVDDSDDDDVGEQQDAFPMRGRQNTFFPIMFSGYPGRSSNGGSNGGGGVTAIANSYSTGKGGVATSHATAYGGPAPRSKSSKKQQVDDDENDE